MKALLTLMTFMLLATQTMAAPGKLQNDDFKTPAQLTAAGAPLSKLLNDTKVWVTANGINQQLSQAITAGVIGGGSGENLLKNGDFEASGVSGWSTFSTTVTNLLPTTAPAACASCSLAISANTADPLNKTASLQLAAATGVTVGHGFISDPFPVAKKYRGGVMTIRAAYQLVSGAPNISGTSSNTFAIYVWDATNSKWIQPAGTYGISGSFGAISPASFQFDSNVTSAQLAIVAVNPLVTPTTSLFDDLMVGPQPQVIAPAKFDGKPFTCTTNLSNATCAGRYRQDGEYLEGQNVITLTGTPGAVAIINTSIPAGLVIDTTKTATNGQTTLGSWAALDASASATYAGDTYYGTTTTVNLGYRNGAATGIATTATAPFATAVNDYYVVNYRVPISGWQTGVQQSSDYDGRNVTLSANKIATQSITANSTLISFPSAIIDRAGAWNGVDTYTVQVAGDYVVSGGVQHGAAGGTPYVVLNGVQPAWGGYWNSQVANGIASGSVTLAGLKVNDTIALRHTVSQTLGAAGNLSIVRVGGSQPVQLQPSVVAMYSLGANQSVAAAGVIKYDTKQRDTNSAYAPATGLFSAPVSGQYRVSVLGTTTNTQTSLYVLKNGAVYGYLLLTPTNGGAVSGSIPVYLNQGESVGVYSDVAATFVGPGARGILNQLTVERTGN